MARPTKPMDLFLTVLEAKCQGSVTLGWNYGMSAVVPGEGNANPLQYPCLENPMDGGAWWATYSPWGCKELDTTEQLHFHFSLSCTGEGNGSPLQCSCLENPRDGGAWWAAVSGVAQGLTRLKWLSSNSIFTYSQPSSSHSIDADKTASTFCLTVIPMLNPVVCSLRNEEVKSAFKKAVEKAKLSLGFMS